jgi:hypothetical protein
MGPKLRSVSTINDNRNIIKEKNPIIKYLLILFHLR